MIALVNATANRIPLPDDSVHCVATSPPYWGLRDYGLPPRIWDGEEGCRHVWGDELIQHQRGQVGENSTLDGGLQAGGEGRLQETRQGQFCQLCGAWRGSLGLEPRIELYVSHLVDVFREVRRVLHPSGTVWLNLGDSYATSPPGNKGFHYGKGRAAQGTLETGHQGIPSGLKPKQLCMIPARVVLALQADGWWLRSQIIWHKPSAMPESITDRPTTAHEYIFLLAKSKTYFYDAEAIKEESVTDPDSKAAMAFGSVDGKNNTSDRAHAADLGHKWKYAPKRNKRTVWTIAAQPYKGCHYAVFPPALVEPMIKAGSSEHGVCPECLAPWQRVKEPTPEYAELLGNDWADYDQDEEDGRGHFILPDGTQSGQRPVKRNAPSISAEYITTGWRPTCDHGHDPIPATILDPFCGSGTTLQVARQLGRHGIGLDLSYDYLHDQARERLGLTAWDAWHEGGNSKEGEPLQELPLFEGFPNA